MSSSAKSLAPLRVRLERALSPRRPGATIRRGQDGHRYAEWPLPPCRGRPLDSGRARHPDPGPPKPCRWGASGNCRRPPITGRSSTARAGTRGGIVDGATLMSDRGRSGLARRIERELAEAGGLPSPVRVDGAMPQGVRADRPCGAAGAGRGLVARAGRTCTGQGPVPGLAAAAPLGPPGSLAGPRLWAPVRPVQNGPVLRSRPASGAGVGLRT